MQSLSTGDMMDTRHARQFFRVSEKPGRIVMHITTSMVLAIHMDRSATS